jgi:hypothetical protein
VIGESSKEVAFNRETDRESWKRDLVLGELHVQKPCGRTGLGPVGFILDSLAVPKALVFPL